MAGVCIFSPPRLLIQEPRGQERQGLMMMPGDPVPHLIVDQAGLSFGTLKTLRHDEQPWPRGPVPPVASPGSHSKSNNQVENSYRHEAPASGTAVLRDLFPTTRSAPDPDTKQLRSPSVLSLRRAPRFGSKLRREVGNTIGPPAGTAAWDVDHVPSTPAQPPRYREPWCLCFAGSDRVSS